MPVRDREKSNEELIDRPPHAGEDLRAARLRIQRRLAEWRGELNERANALDSQLDRTGASPSTRRPVTTVYPVEEVTEWLPPVPAPAPEPVREPEPVPVPPPLPEPALPEPFQPPPTTERAPSEVAPPRGLRQRVEEAVPLAIALPVGAALTLGVAAAYVWLAVSDGGFQASTYAAMGLVVWWAAALALLLRIWPAAGLPRSTAAAGVLLAGFSILALLSTTWAEDGGRAFAEALRAVAYLGVFVLAAIVARAGGARQLLGGIAIGLAVLTGLALLSRLQPGLVGNEAELQRLLPESAGRLSYPIGYWNGLAACMALAICLFTWLGADARSRVARALAIAALPLPTLVIYLTGSRGGGIAALVGLAALLALAPQRWRTLAVITLGTAGSVVLLVIAGAAEDLVRGLDTSNASSAGDTLTIAALAVAAVLGLLAYRWDGALERFSPTRLGIPGPIAAGVIVIAVLIANYVIDPGEQLKERRTGTEISTRIQQVDEVVTTGTTTGRIEYWESAVKGFETEPILGLGAGEFESWWTQHGALSQPVSNAHSLYLETLAELGVVGLALVLAFLGVAGIAGARRTLAERRRDRLDPSVGVGAVALAMLIAGIVSAAGEWTWELPAAFAPVVVAGAILCTPAAAGARSQRRAPGGPLRLGIMLLVSTLAIAGLGVLYMSELRLTQSRVAAAEEDFELAANRAEQASDLQPWDAEPYTQLALIERSRGHDVAAKEAIAEAIERAPEDWRLWFVSAHIEYDLGNYAAERTALARARELAPRAPASLFVTPGPRTPATPMMPEAEGGKPAKQSDGEREKGS